MNSPSELQRIKCASNIKVGTNIILKEMYGEDIEAVIAGFTTNYNKYKKNNFSILLASNKKYIFWRMHTRINDPLYVLKEQISNIDDYPFKYWITVRHLENHAYPAKKK